MAKWKSPEDIKRIRSVKARLDAKRATPPPEPLPKPKLVMTRVFPDIEKNVKRDALDPDAHDEKPKRRSGKKTKKNKKKNDRN